MSVYRNTGARWLRADGTYVETGAEFVPTEDERLRKAYKLEYVGPEPGEPAPAPAPRGVDIEDYALGGGWYMVAGEKVQGRAAATERLNEHGDE